MRKVTETVVHAFFDGEYRKVRNTATDGQTLWLHGNAIAWHGERGNHTGIFLTLAGWNTPTTRERLNGVLAVMGHKRTQDGDLVLSIFQEKHLPYIGQHGVDGSSSDSRKLLLDPEAVLFIVHPNIARGLFAVRSIET